MNRRELLKGMLAAGLVVPSTKFIFNLGANKRALDLSKYRFVSTIKGMFIQLPIMNPEYEEAPYEELIIFPKGTKISKPQFPRRFDYELIEVLPFRV